MTHWNARGLGELSGLDLEFGTGQIILLASADGRLASLAVQALAEESERRRRRAQGIEWAPNREHGDGLLASESRLPLCTSWFAGEAAEPSLESLARLTGISDELLPDGVSERSHPCPACSGLGIGLELAEERLVDEGKSLEEGALRHWHRINAAYYQGVLQELCTRHGIDMSCPWSALSKAARHLLLHGESEEGGFAGAVADLHLRVERTLERGERMGELEEFIRYHPCTACAGSALDEEGRQTLIGDLSVLDCFAKSLAERLEASHARSVARGRLELACALGLGAHRLGASVPALDSKERAVGRLVPLLSSGLVESCVLLDAPAEILAGDAALSLSARLRWMSHRGTTILLSQSGDGVLEGLEPTAVVRL